MIESKKTLTISLREALQTIADPARAPKMQSYMKSEMPYLGVASTPLKATCKKLFTEHPVSDATSWRQDVLSLWRDAKFREERYGAIELAADKRAKKFQTIEALPMYEEMITSGAWWDYVDALASHQLGDILRAEPEAMKQTMRQWSTCDNMWKRRSSIICQLSFKKNTDLVLLVDCMTPSLDSKEFFLRKAIGWALRQYAWVDPKWVKKYVKDNEEKLSGLSKREALKNFKRAA
jgi:3-methyladenine DNA glycosylase AlkD